MSDEVIKTILTADSGELAAEFAKASAIAQKYAADREAQGSRALASARASVEALRLEATGHAGAAAALREKIQLQETARRLAQSTGLSEANALQIASRELALKKQIADQAARAERSASIAKQAAEEQAAWLRNRAAMESTAAAKQARLNSPGRSGIGLPEITLAQQLTFEKANTRAQILRQSLGQLGDSGANARNGMLQLAYAIDDAQYGMKGLSNNIPAVISAFGAGGGMAAAIGIAAISLFAYWKLMRLVFKADEVDAFHEAAVKGGKAWAQAWKEAREEMAKTRAEAALQKDVTNWVDRSNDSLRENVTIQDQILQRMQLQNQLRSEARQREDDLRTAREAVTIASGGTVDPTEKNAVERQRLADDLKSAQEESARAQQESLRLNQARTAIQQESAARTAEYEKQIDTLKDSLTGSKANIADYQARLGTIKESDTEGRRITQDALDAAQKHAAAIEKQIRELEAYRDAQKQVADQNAATAQSNIEKMDEQANKAYQIAESLKLQVPVLEEIQRLRKEAEDIAKAREDAAKQERETARAAEEKARADEAQARKEKDTQRERIDFMAELAALQREAAGDARGAELLRQEVKLRMEAVTLAERLGVSEEQAQELLRQRADLEKRIADQRKKQESADGGENRRQRALIYKKTAGEERLTPTHYERGFYGPRGFRNHELQRRATDRSLRPTDRAEESAKTLLRSVNLQEEMLKLWRNLTTV